jgi:small GTP-binding protein
MYRTAPHDSVRKDDHLGNSGVGKTSLAYRWVHDAFDPAICETIGPTNITRAVDIGSKQVTIALWDTAGQEQFRSIVPLYVRGARTAVVVVSADSPESFDSLSGWLELLNSVQDQKVQAVLAVNKMDMRDPGAPDVSELVDSHRSLFAACFFVSALTGESVNQLFRAVAKIADESFVITDDAQVECKEEPPVVDERQCC